MNSEELTKWITWLTELLQHLHSSISKLVSKLWKPAKLNSLRRDGHSVGGRPWAGKAATTGNSAPTTAAESPFAVHHAVCVDYFIWFDLMKTRNRTVTKSLNNEHETYSRKKESPQEEVEFVTQSSEQPWARLQPESFSQRQKRGSFH